MEKFKTPKLLITDHYDEQIRQVDIYIEKLLEIYNEIDLLPEEINRSYTNDDDSDDELSYSDWDDDTIHNIDGFQDPYRSEYKYDKNKLLRLDVIPETNRVRDYLELVRSKAIEELKKAEQYNLDNYELNKDLYKYDRETLTDEKVEEMRENLFKDNFAFVIVGTPNKLLKSHTILTDFYLDGNDLTAIKRHFQRLRKPTQDEIITWPTQDEIEKMATGILDEKCLFLHLVSEYIIGFDRSYEYGNEIISIRKSSLFEQIDRLKIDYMIIDSVYLPFSTSIDFSFIKSLRLDYVKGSKTRYNIRDLSGLRQLEYLKIEGMSFNDDSFIGLEKLISLQLKQCFSTGEKLCFNSLNNLQILRIQELYFPIELKSLENLRALIIEGMDKFEYIINVSESITYLNLSSFDINISTADEFFSRVYLPNLLYLYLNYNGLTYLKEHWFSVVLLKELILRVNHLENLDFCQFECMKQLEKLDLDDNRIEKLDEKLLSKIQRLKYLNLSFNYILELGSNKFLCLKNLECLYLTRINERKKFNRIEKDTFNGLTNLKRLNLDLNYLIYIDSEAFSHTPKLMELSLNSNSLGSIDIDPKVFSYTPKLVELRICDNKMKLEENMFSNLKHVKKIVVKESDVEYIKMDLFENLIKIL